MLYSLLQGHHPETWNMRKLGCEVIGKKKLDNSVSIHHRHLEILATEMFKVNMNLSPDIINDIFIKRTNPYTVRRNDTFPIRQVSFVYHGPNPCRFWG